MNAYIISWKSRVTGLCGKGTEYMDFHSATNLVKLLNKEYPEIKHTMSG